jgi:hypothetical protein
MADLRKIMNKCSERYRWIWVTVIFVKQRNFSIYQVTAIASGLSYEYHSI